MKELVDKETIIKRSDEYGNNFPFLVEIWKNFLKLRYNIDVPLTPKDVAFMFSLHKVSRLANNPADQDTLRDMINYAWLGIDYDEYVQLLENDNKVVESFIEELKKWEETQQKEEQNEYWCFWYNKKCVYAEDQNCENKQYCPMGYDNWEDCDFNSPVQIN